MEIKIVGSIPDENSLDEIQSIAKVFVYEQRMKNFKYPIKENNPIKKKVINPFKKIDKQNKIFENYMYYVQVKGLI